MATPAKKKDFNKTPQELVTEFWDQFFVKKPGKVTRIFPRSLYETLLPPSQPQGVSSSRNATDSYLAAVKECKEKVKRIVKECERTNEKFTDPDFDIEGDFDIRNCLHGLTHDADLEEFYGELQQLYDLGATKGKKGAKSRSRGAPRSAEDALETPAPKDSKGREGVKAGWRETFSPGSVHRLDWIFESPQWTKDGYSSSDIKQGCDGDCWWLAAVATIAHRKDLMDKVCVARDEEVGVYGFVFFKDGEWISTVVDDNLYLTEEDYRHHYDEYDPTGKKGRKHRKDKQTGSEALYFSQCSDPNETWLPLLEKAYAKVHGDYEAISGGWPGEGVEDMTGGVSAMLQSNRVLRKDKLWKELVNSNGDFVFSCSAHGHADTRGSIANGHAYSILKATEEVDEDGRKVRLVKIRNPWGERTPWGTGEWDGPWSDGSKEWTPYWLRKLDHKFGDDGEFWMSYQDMLDNFMYLYRTRLFDDKWNVVQQWTTVTVGWIAGYLNKKFVIEIKKEGTVVIVLSQLDERYFQGLEGQYRFILHFVLQDKDGKEQLCRVRPTLDWSSRSVSCELDLEPGRYEVLPKITVQRDTSQRMVEDVVTRWAEENPTKLRQIGMQYDLAHAKGGVHDEDEIITQRKEKMKKKEERKKAKAKAMREKERREKRKQKQVQITINMPEGSTVATSGTGTEADKKEEKKETAEEKKEEEEKFEDAVEEKSKDDEKKDGEKKHEEPPKKVSAPSSSSKSAADVAAGEGKKTEKAGEKKEGTAAAAEKKKIEEKPAREEKKEEEKVPVEEQKTTRAPAAAAEEVQEDLSEDEEEEEEEPKIEYEEGKIPWNAVCVVGLRVYAQDPDVTVTLATPSTAEEGASLVMDQHAVGATI
ncbi:hypothetical protein B0H65DRAFT_508665 [Neurospora tetraspora]|uniref:Calpain catalytic domain-containing protein n=1 Tax=Neurospora tetraspora TaxID=94610 RepID=A0AAE0JEF7_9PEZI|nr:hypothetical protein B0H65DRAFT_508665 [Neurospora tetraspora]